MTQKIAVLIPAYKREFIQATLSAVLRQTRSPDLIAISDDSPGNIVTDDLRAFLRNRPADARRIEFIEGPKSGGAANMIHLLRHFEGTGYGLYHMLSDDDLVAPTFYEAHQWLMSEEPGAQVSISKRTVIDAQGWTVNLHPYPSRITCSSERKMLLKAEVLYRSTVPVNVNWLGEYSNCVFRSEFAMHATRSQLGSIPYYGLNDIGFFLEMSEIHPIAFVNDYLGSFRVSPQANSSNRHLNVVRWGVLAWLAIGIHAWLQGHLSDAELSACAKRVLRNHASIYGAGKNALVEAAYDVARLHPDSPARFIAAWFESLAGFPEGQRYLAHAESLEMAIT